MKEEEKLIEKWLANTLTDAELNSLEDSSEFASYKKIDAIAKRYKSPDFDITKSLDEIKTEKKQVNNKTSYFKYIASIAAVLIIALGIFKFVGNDSSNVYYADNGVKENLLLPDTSEVTLNSGSQISFDEKEWATNRNLKLEGEAYFKVEKGNTFSVNSSQGIVTVLGTEFIVKDRPGYFEVTCYEGLVSVKTNSKDYKLPAGNSIKIINDKVIKNNILATTPSWISEISIFKSTPLKFVVNELERQYNITINSKNIDTTVIFTGSFTHTDINAALQSITKPLSLTYEVNGKNVTLKN